MKSLHRFEGILLLLQNPVVGYHGLAIGYYELLAINVFDTSISRSRLY